VPGAIHPRFAQFPSALAQRARIVRLGPARDIPALLAHPDALSPTPRPRPTVIWLHGRTASKELDPGRYLRWIRAGIAVCALDLPAHGERADLARQQPEHSLDTLAHALRDIDAVVADLPGLDWPIATGQRSTTSLFDTTRLALGGMSLGGMTTLRRLCDPHPFACAAVEGTTGWLAALYDPGAAGVPSAAHRWTTPHDPAKVAALDPFPRVDAIRPIPILALHSEADEIVPWEGQRRFLDTLRQAYASHGADPTLVRHMTWPTTGAPQEHAGFGRVAADAKTAQTEFLARHLGAEPPTDA
jgi:alpha-beta hydrolase superfamily lysophospholipase